MNVTRKGFRDLELQQALVHVIGPFAGACTEAVRVVSFISDICTDRTCPCMSAGEKVHYHWADETTAVPELLPAPQYMRRLVEWADAKLLDQDLLPLDGSPMPPELRPVLSQILRRLFRVYAHA
ncbi:mobA, partial [Symbiodinium sp. CCMP2456]